ncbi:MAG: DUF4214 domain-containing protein [Pseudomonadota bacterium]
MISPTTPLADLFYSDYFGVRWADPGETRVVTWSTTNGTLDVPGQPDVAATRDAAPYMAAFERAFQLWDEALSSVAFRYTDEGNRADITLAITDLGGRGGTWGFWNSSWTNERVTTATIQFDEADIDRISVTTIALHEIGNVLGLGDIRPSSSYRSVQEDPIPESFSGDRLWDDDIALIRRVYEEDPDAPLGRYVWGTSADDVMTGGTGNDTLFGDAGQDTLELQAGIDAYAVTVDASSTVRLSDRGRAETGQDVLTQVEAVSFAAGNAALPDGRLDLDALTGIADLTVAEITTFTEMYIAYFDRAPDALGLFYWGTRFSEGMTLAEIAESFFVQPETRALYPSDMANSDLVREAYENFFERAPDGAGWAYWTAELDAGFSRGKFMLALINGARDNTDPQARADVATIEAKAEIGLHFAAIHGLNDVAAAQDVMQTYIRGQSDSLADALRRTDSYADAAAGGPDEAFTLSLIGVLDDPSAAMI